MSEIYLILVVVLFALAISDLIVGVSNDAVNFLNSAIGSKAAPKWLIFTVASIGVIVGSTFSSGMMEVARKGIFHPEMFVFTEIMVIFLAVMITDVILLDMFNTFGMPTSTTVSIVFELLGSAVAVSLVKMRELGQAASHLGDYINSERAMLIIFGILISVVISFSVGALIQWLTRIVFSFRYDKRFTYFGSLYGGLSIAVITYFMIIKGAKGASFISEETASFMKNNMMMIFWVSFVGWTVLLQLLRWLFKIDILKIIVLVGTFALAMAFAGNDLVNFIGVPLAGFSSFKAWMASGAGADSFTMSILTEKVRTPTFMLLGAGVIMVITIITSRKARNVVKTSIDLARQNEGVERFGSSAASRVVVRASVQLNDYFIKVVPQSILQRIDRQFVAAEVNDQLPIEDRQAFDKLRAATGLIVSSILIAVGTSLKLPLSTTYVTFMVAMGTSLADRAWGRESAVYRISGVFAVIGGWFLTAFIAFTVAFIMARIMMWGGHIATFALVCLALFSIVRTQILFRRKQQKEKDDEEPVDQYINTTKVLEKCNKNTVNAIIATSKAYSLCFDGFFNNDRQQIKNAVKEVDQFNAKAKKLKDNVYKNIQKLNQDSIETGHFYVQVVDYLRELAHSLNYVITPVYTHFENKHKAFTDDQIQNFNEFGVDLNEFLNFALHLLKEEKFENLDELIGQRDNLVKKLKELEKNQIKRIKDKSVSTRNSVLYFKIITETRNMLLHLINVVKAQRDFITETSIQSDSEL
ncbi:MAG: inorganic phosphate transporter [Prolixibacteraceae bacterium]